MSPGGRGGPSYGRARRAAVLAVGASLAVAAWLGVASDAPESASAKNKKKPALGLGLVDPVFQAPDPATRALWLDRAVQAGAGRIRLLANWRSIINGPQPPADPANPASTGYDFTGLDAAVRDAAARGLGIVITINRAPPWAEGPDRDPSYPAASWLPSPERLAEFSTAIATRYSGSFGDLPRVSLWEIWGEPNLPTHLSPQSADGKLVGPDHYRKMFDAASAAINKVSGSNKVIGSGTAPFGDQGAPGVTQGAHFYRTPPLTFWREFFCLEGRKLKPKPKKCPGGKARIDAFAHNPLAGLAGNEFLPTLGPYDKAPNPTDILVPDMHKLYDVLQAAQEHKRVKPRKGTELWVSELLWESNPPETGPTGVPLDTQAQFLAQSLKLLRSQGVSQVHWVRLVDAELEDDPDTNLLQSGLYFSDGTPKPALDSFHSP